MSCTFCGSQGPMRGIVSCESCARALTEISKQSHAAASQAATDSEYDELYRSAYAELCAADARQSDGSLITA